jgi:hypothetical protein
VYPRRADNGRSRRQKSGSRKKTHAEGTEFTKKRKAAERFIAQKACDGKEYLTRRRRGFGMTEDAERGGASDCKSGGEPPQSKGEPKSTVRSDCATRETHRTKSVRWKRVPQFADSVGMTGPGCVKQEANG